MSSTPAQSSHPQPLHSCGTHTFSTEQVATIFRARFSASWQPKGRYHQGFCCKPDAVWMKAQARAFLEHVENSDDPKISHIIHDYDGKFVNEFDNTLREAGVKVKRVGPRAPNMNAFIERWIQSIKYEVLNHFIICGADNFNYLISEYQEYYHTARPHQGVGSKLLTGGLTAKADEMLDLDQIKCHDRLGGLLKHYYHQAA